MEEFMGEFGMQLPTIIKGNEPHMACLLLLDTSGSMSGAPIQELNAGINRFKEEVCEDRHACDVVDVAIVEFNSTYNPVQSFTPVQFMDNVNLQAGGGTNMGPAIRCAINMVKERTELYMKTGTRPYKPWIVMISDGEPQDDITDVAREIQDLEERGKLKFFSLGVGEYDSETLHKLSGPKVMKLKNNDFSSFFNWLNKSMVSVSMSSPTEVPIGIPLPENVDKDTNDWMG